MELLDKTIRGIKPSVLEIENEVMRCWDNIAKPIRGLGKLEYMVARLGAISGSVNPSIDKRALIVMCSDNGVVAEGVTQTDSSVTAIVAENFFDMKTCTSIMCNNVGCDVFVLDVGMATDTERTEKAKLSYGTKNFVHGPAMTREEAIFAIETGIRKVQSLVEDGYRIIATGEMGIGNTTTSSAIASVLLDIDPEAITGRGAGLSDEGLIRKINAIKKGIEINNPDREDSLDVLMKVGGFDIAALCGVFLGGAYYRVPIIIDGFISSVAALLAYRFNNLVGEYMLPSHSSGERGQDLVLRELSLDAMLDGDFCLGEGSGAIMLLPLLDMALDVYKNMASFADIKIEAYVPLS